MKRFLCLLLLTAMLSGCASGPEAAPATTLPAETAAAMAALPSVPPTEAPEETTAPEPAETEPGETEPAETEPAQERFVLTFAGDCTFGCQSGVYYAELGFPKTIGKDYGWPFRNVMQYFGEDDFTMVNLECVLGAKGAAPVPKAHNLRGKAAYAKILTQGSVEAVTLANNHSWDYGKTGYASTKNALEKEGVPYVEKGATLLHKTQSGLTIGIYAEEYTDMDMKRLKKSVQQLREDGAEIIIYALHWGKENSYYPQKHQITWAHKAIDAGVDILMGHHPHVLQLYEEYKGKPIFYSLGNFSFGGNTSPQDKDTAIGQVVVVRSPEGEITVEQVNLIPARISSVSGRNNYQPTPYKEGSKGYQRVLDKLAGRWKGRDLS